MLCQLLHTRKPTPRPSLQEHHSESPIRRVITMPLRCGQLCRRHGALVCCLFAHLRYAMPAAASTSLRHHLQHKLVPQLTILATPEVPVWPHLVPVAQLVPTPWLQQRHERCVLQLCNMVEDGREARVAGRWRAFVKHGGYASTGHNARSQRLYEVLNTLLVPCIKVHFHLGQSRCGV